MKTEKAGQNLTTIFLVSIFIVPVLIGCAEIDRGNPTSSTTTSTTIAARIFGKVLFADYPAGVKGQITVEVEGRPEYAVSTDSATGTFEINANGLSVGTHTIIASKDGWIIPPLQFIFNGTSTSENNLTNATPEGWQILPYSAERPDFIRLIATSETSFLYAIGRSESYFSGDWTSIGHPLTSAVLNGVIKRLNSTSNNFSVIDNTGYRWKFENNNWAYDGEPIIVNPDGNIFAKEIIYNENTDQTQEALGFYGVPYCTTNGGISWSNSGANWYDTTKALGYCQDTSSGLVKIVCNGLGKVKIYNNGEWGDELSISTGSLNDVCKISGSNYALVSTSGEVYQLTVSGNSGTASVILSGIPYSINGVCLENGDLTICGNNGLAMQRVSP
jgi:hypothetical protein